MSFSRHFVIANQSFHTCPLLICDTLSFFIQCVHYRLVAKRYYSGIFVGEKEKLAAQRAWQLASDQVRLGGSSPHLQVYTMVSNHQRFAIFSLRCARPRGSKPLASAFSAKCTPNSVGRSRSPSVALWPSRKLRFPSLRFPSLLRLLCPRRGWKSTITAATLL